MTRTTQRTGQLILAMSTWSLAACVGDTAEPQQPSRDPRVLALYAASQSSGVAAAAGAPCERGILEPDLFTLPLSGPGVSLGVVKSGEYVLSSTYLRLIESDAASTKFWEVLTPIMEDLAARDGLVALSLGLSLECNTARTLSVWRDDIAMLEFVASPAHVAAVAAGDQLNRGGSVVMHWTGDETQATWKAASEQLAAFDGPIL